MSGAGGPKAGTQPVALLGRQPETPAAARVRKLALPLLLVLHAAQLLHLAAVTGETYDEPMYLMASANQWAAGDVTLNREHPPLLKWLIGAPLAWVGAELPPDPHTDVAGPQRFLYELNDDPAQLLLLGRLPMVALGLLLLLSVYALSRHCFGEGPALVAALALVLQPALTGHTPLAALDAGAATFAFLACHALLLLRQQPGPARTLLVGLALGAALLCRFTNLALLPAFAALALWDACSRRAVAPLLRFAALLLVAGSTLFAGYLFEARPLSELADHPRFAAGEGESVLGHPLLARAALLFGDGPLPMPSLWKGLDATVGGTLGKGHLGSFRGEHGKGVSWLSYYATLLAIKTPAGLLCLMLLALLLLPRLPSAPGLAGVLLLFPALVLVAASTSVSQLGVRYVLVLCPALAVLVGWLVAALDGRRLQSMPSAAHLRGAALLALVALPVLLFLAFPERGSATAASWAVLLVPVVLGLTLVRAAGGSAERVRRCLAAVLVTLLALASVEVLATPHGPLVFSNAFAGGPERSWAINAVGDDWGQGVPQLAALQTERNWPRLNYQPYGTGNPDQHGLRWRGWGGAPLLAWDSNLLALHTAQLTRDPTRYTLVEGLEPVAYVEGILVFDVPPERLVGPR